MNPKEATALLGELVEDYRTELEKLPFQKKVRETLIDGFRDGARSALARVLSGAKEGGSS